MVTYNSFVGRRRREAGPRRTIAHWPAERRFSWRPPSTAAPQPVLTLEA